jgi:cold shock protein
MEGVVKRFNPIKGWGFLTSKEFGGDIFVHHRAIQMDGFRTLREGQSVDFDVVIDGRGEHAENVRVIAAVPNRKGKI